MNAHAHPTTAMGPALAYSRVSTEEQTRDDRTSLRDQRAAVKALAKRIGLTLSDADVYEDRGRSGATAEGRPAFLRLVRYCEQHRQPPERPGYVLVLNDSRWGRFSNPEEATYWRVHLSKAGWHVQFAEDDDTEDPTARGVLRSIYSAQASAYREGIKANAKRGARGTAAQGFWQNEAPLGYRRQTVGGARPGTPLEPGQRKAEDEKVRLVPGPAAEQRVIRFMYERYATGQVSLAMLAEELTVKYPQRKWGRQTVRAVLRNAAYVGDVVWCRRPHDAEEAHRTPVRPKDQWVTARDAHLAIVTRDLFDRVQARLAMNQRQTRATAGGYPLSGLIRCAHCDAGYIGGGGPKNRRDPSDPDRYRFYKDSGNCNTAGYLGTLQKRLVEPQVIAAVSDVVAHPKVQRMIAQEVDRALNVTGEAAKEQRGELETERARLANERDRLVAAIARGVLGDEEAAPTLALLRRQLDAATAEIERLRFGNRQVQRLQAERGRLVKLAADFVSQAKQLRGAALRELLRPWLQDARVDKVRRTLTLTIRQVPAEGVFLHSANGPGRGSP